MNEELVHKLNNKLFEDNDFIYSTYPGNDFIKNIDQMSSEYLSEPYLRFTLQFFEYNYPDCTIICYDKTNLNYIGLIVGNVEIKGKKKKGYIGMLAVKKEFRKRGIGRKLVSLLIDKFDKVYNVSRIYLETEADNFGALHLYESLGFIRTKFYKKYYLNGNSAYKLKFYISE